MGQILRINLDTKTVKVESPSEDDLKQYIGGQGVAAAIFAREVSPTVDAFAPENLLIFSVGPFCGTAVPFCGRHFVLSKSPLTGLMGEASAGGFWGREFKSTGFDHIIIQGKSAKPAYLWIKDGSVEIRDAAGIWGNGVSETEAALKQELNDDKIKVASIGIAGEKLVRFAAIMSEEHRAAGRCGLGAVMGSKNLKAIAVRGTGKVEVANKDAVLAAANEIREEVKKSPLALVFSDSGTPTSMDSMTGIGDVPMQNYTLSRWKGTEKIGATALKQRGVKMHACFNCPVACTGQIDVNGKLVRWPEYETLAMLGSNLLVDDLEAIIRWNLLANDFGMDTVSLGGVIAMFLEAAARGLFPNVNLADLGFQPDPEKPDARKVWGAVQGVENLIKAIGNRTGIGADLSEGVKRCSEKFNLPKELATHAKGLEVPAHEPRANNMTALDYVTTPRGAFHCYLPMHVSSSMNFKKEIGVAAVVDRFNAEKAAVETVIKLQDASEAYSAAGGCIFGFHFIPVLIPWVNALGGITGRPYSVDAWMESGRRLVNLKRAYNLKCGASKADDCLGTRFSTPIDKGGTKKNVPPLDKMLPLYYELRGWV